jgi:hypothetical protein
MPRLVQYDVLQRQHNTSNFLDFSLIPLMNSITERLSMPDFTPSTQRVEYALADYLRGSALERAQIYEILNRVGALSAEEIRIQEEMIR